MVTIADVSTATLAPAIAAAPGAVLVDFWSDDCAPCRALAPVLHDLAQDFAGELTVLKADVGAEPSLREAFGVRGVPTLVLFRGGAEIDRIQGARTRSALAAWIEERL